MNKDAYISDLEQNCRRLNAELSSLRTRSKRVEAIIEAYADHQIGCKTRQDYSKDCNCGYETALASLEVA